MVNNYKLQHTLLVVHNLVCIAMAIGWAPMVRIQNIACFTLHIQRFECHPCQRDVREKKEMSTKHYEGFQALVAALNMPLSVFCCTTEFIWYQNTLITEYKIHNFMHDYAHGLILNYSCILYVSVYFTSWCSWIQVSTLEWPAEWCEMCISHNVPPTKHHLLW